MSDDDIRRIADAIEKIVSAAKKKDSPSIELSMHAFYAEEIQTILDAQMNDFELRRVLRKLVDRARQASTQ
jgi:hypothetical protein